MQTELTQEAEFWLGAALEVTSYIAEVTQESVRWNRTLHRLETALASLTEGMVRP